MLPINLAGNTAEASKDLSSTEAQVSQLMLTTLNNYSTISKLYAPV